MCIMYILIYFRKLCKRAAPTHFKIFSVHFYLYNLENILTDIEFTKQIKNIVA